MISVKGIKLIGVTAFSAFAALFVESYTWAAHLRFMWEHHQSPTMNGAVFFLHYWVVGYSIPLIVGITGTICIVRKRPLEIVLEAILWAGIVASLAWICFALFTWELANVPNNTFPVPQY